MADASKMRETLETLAARIMRLEESVDAAFLEQRRYTEFAFGQLVKQIEKQIKDVRSEMNGGSVRLDGKLDHVLDALAGTRPRRRRTSWPEPRNFQQPTAALRAPHFLLS